MENITNAMEQKDGTGRQNENSLFVFVRKSLSIIRNNLGKMLRWRPALRHVEAWLHLICPNEQVQTRLGCYAVGNPVVFHFPELCCGLKSIFNAIKLPQTFVPLCSNIQYLSYRLAVVLGIAGLTALMT